MLESKRPAIRHNCKTGQQTFPERTSESREVYPMSEGGGQLTKDPIDSLTV